jgi:hypothetical protein
VEENLRMLAFLLAWAALYFVVFRDTTFAYKQNKVPEVARQRVVLVPPILDRGPGDAYTYGNVAQQREQPYFIFNNYHKEFATQWGQQFVMNDPNWMMAIRKGLMREAVKKPYLLDKAYTGRQNTWGFRERTTTPHWPVFTPASKNVTAIIPVQNP